MNDVWTTMDVGNLNLESTFGPFGKRKVVTNETGGVVITRDGQSVVPHCLRWVGNDFLKFLCMESVKMSSRSGDGLLTLIMIANYFLGKISESYEVATFSMPSRIRSLRSIEAIRATAERFKSYIFDHLVLYGIWKQEIPYAERIRMLCSSVVVPSANKEIYNKISFIMGEWTRTCIGEDEVMGCCRKRVYEVTKLLDVLMHKSIGTRSPSLSEPVAQFIEKVDLLLKGRCREQKVVSQLSARMQGFSILFIKQLMLGSEQIMEHNLLLPSLNDFFTVRRSFTSELEALAQLLLTQKENNGPFLIICGDKVEDEAVHLLSNTGIFLIDCVPGEYMEYGSLRTGSNLHENIAEFVEAQALQIDPDGTVNSIARIVCVERIVLGNSNEVHLLLKGIVRPAADAPAKEGTKHLRRHGWSALPQQLILHGASALVVGVYVNLLRRCLKVVAASLQEEGTSSSCSGSGEQYNAVLVPGAGAGELTWSLLWSQLASYLSNCDMSDARRSSNDENSQTTSLRAVACTEGGTLEDVLRPLVSCLGEAIARRLAHSCPVALPECVHLCEILSAAYQQVPLTLLANAKDVLPASLLGDLNAASGADGEVAGNMRNPGNINRALQVWSHRLQSAGEGRGRLGLVYCTDVDAEEICTLQDAAAGGIACSANLFWEVFTQAVDFARLQLRVGGQDGIIRVKIRRKRSSQPRSGVERNNRNAKPHDSNRENDDEYYT